ncbi:DsbA family protein [Paraferrimonas sp. SM1919]|uniref:DsbA family oxidoreductase n=1 Tax=Paraferrimonas sp. SM1919 TaxID=2662263 RepID=UPI0013D4521D|nr:DsbA family protein [Paraferrimonas sp. SM1919]
MPAIILPKLALISANFSNLQDLSNLDTLANIAQDLDLPAEVALTFINCDDAKSEFNAEEAKWKNLGVNSLPTLAFNMKQDLPGAQSVDVYKQLLKQYLGL